MGAAGAGAVVGWHGSPWGAYFAAPTPCWVSQVVAPGASARIAGCCSTWAQLVHMTTSQLGSTCTARLSPLYCMVTTLIHCQLYCLYRQHHLRCPRDAARHRVWQGGGCVERGCTAVRDAVRIPTLHQQRRQQRGGECRGRKVSRPTQKAHSFENVPVNLTRSNK